VVRAAADRNEGAPAVPARSFADFTFLSRSQHRKQIFRPFALSVPQVSGARDPTFLYKGAA